MQKFGSTRAALGAKFGLGLLQLTADNPDFAKAVELFTPAANDGGFADRGQALYQLGVCQRALGLRELDKNKGEADKRFAKAQNSFRTAMDWFTGQKQDDWSGRSRCDLAEMLIRTGKVKDARGVCEPFVKEPAFAKNKHRPLGLYFHGLACFLDKDLNAAGRSLNQLAPFTDPAFGPHARYLVGRVLHLQGESAEASVHYDAVLADHDKSKAAAVEAVKALNRFKGNPFELTRLRRLASGPTPEYVAGAAFHTAALKYEAGKFADAVDKFQQFTKQFDADPLAPDAALRVGLCQVQLRQFDEAAKTLAPLVEKTPRLADQAQFWLGKARFGLAQGIDPNNPAEREKRTKEAFDTLRQAIDKANGGDDEAKARRRDMLFDLGDALLGAKQPKEAAGVFEQLWNDQSRLSPLRREEALQRLGQALGEANDLQKSDDRVAEFRLFPNSTLTAAVVFRGAENAYARAVDAAKKSEAKQRHEDAASKFQEVASKFPEFERVHHARLLAAVCLVQVNNLDAAVKLLDAIPGPDRTGELALAAYLLGDILLRQTPTAVAADALEENKAREKLTAAAAQFDGFVSGSPKAPEAPAALLKLGHCHKRLAVSLADPNERNQTFQKAREALERLRKEYPNVPLAGTARLELAKVKALQGDRGGAMNDLREALKSDAKTAPHAALHLATMLREEGKAADAEKALADARKRFEQELEKDPERADWVHTLRFHHAAALFEQQKYADARGLFAQVTKPDSLSAEAKLRAGQCKLAEDLKAIQTAAEERNKAGNDKGKRDAAEKKYQDARNVLYQTAVGMADKSAPDSPARGRMCYEAAWAFRELAGEEAYHATEQARKEAHAKLPPNSPWPTVPRGKVPPTRCEQQAFAAYRKLIVALPDTALAVDARFELAELLAERDEHTEAVKLLKAALDAEPADRPTHPDLTERIRLRLGGCLFAVKDYPAAAAQFDAVSGNDKSPHRAQAAYRGGESHAASGDWAKAIERLVPFRDKGEWHNVGGVSDRAVLRLGHALLASGKPDDAKGAFETLLSRFGNGNPYAADARYAVGLVFQAKGQHDEAVKAFEAVIAATQSETAAKAQLGIGYCRFAQKRYADAASAFLVVPYTYDYPEVGFAAGLEAARAFEADGKPADAEKVLNKVLKDAPAESEWRKAAKERLVKLKK